MDNSLNLIDKLKNLTMTNRKCILIVVILVFVISGVVLGYNWAKTDVVSAPVEKSKEAGESVFPEVRWNKYVNHQLGFSIEFPDNVYGGYRCPSEKTIQVPIRAFEDNENGIVYISQEYYYEAERDDKSGERTGPCEKIINSLERLKNKESILGWLPKPFLGWAILIGEVKNKDKLNKFIKENYGPGCSAEDKKFWKLYHQPGVYNISVGGESDNEETTLGTTSCPGAWTTRYKVLYFPEKNKVMTVNLGQDCNFFNYFDTEFYQCYDEEMINSFKFESQ